MFESTLTDDVVNAVSEVLMQSGDTVTMRDLARMYVDHGIDTVPTVDGVIYMTDDAVTITRTIA